MNILEMKKFTFAYPNMDSPVLKDITLSIREGEMSILCGNSGCGKTTLLRSMKPQIAPVGKRSGTIQYDESTEIGFVFQNPDNQIVTDTVRHELAFGLENMGLSTTVIRQRVAETALFFGIDEWIDRSIHQISGGEKQLLNLAAVIAMRPKLLLLDEPTAQLDPVARKNFLELLVRVNRELGIAVLVSEHHLEELLPITDRVLFMEGGSIAYEGTAQAFANYVIEQELPYEQILPAAARIGATLNGNIEPLPLTVRAGRECLGMYDQERPGSLSCAIEEPEKIGRLPYLNMKHIWFRYDKHLPFVLKDLSLAIEQGTLHMLLGGNGSGKTTLLYLLSRRYYANRGKIHVSKGREMPSVGLLTQNPKAMFSEDSVYEEIKRHGCDMRMAETMHLEGLLDRHPYDLSGGEQQRLALLLVLSGEPDILLLDEPTKGLDPMLQEELGRYLRDYAKKGHVVLCVTHDVEFAARYGDTCSLLFEGEVLATEETRTFFEGCTFYTTDAARILRGYIKRGLLCEDLNCV